MRTILIALAAITTVALLAAMTALAIERSRPLTLPSPTGRFAVGRMIGDWKDSAQSDSAAPPAAGAHRELLVWIWYPVSSTLRSLTEPHEPPELKSSRDARRVPFVFRFLTRDPSRVREHSVPNAEVDGDRAYPVLIMRGGASAPVANYSTLAEDLASHGYVVVGFDAPYRTSLVVFPDGRAVARLPSNNPELAIGNADSARMMNRLLDAWTSDIGFVLDRLTRLNAADATGRFTGHLDLSRVGVFGHSLGGIEAAQFCDVDPRCMAAVDIDGAPIGRITRDTLRRPFMFLLSDHRREDDAESQAILASIHAMYHRLPVNGRVSLFIEGANHFTFSDDGALLKSGLVRLVLRLAGQLHIDGRRQLAVTAYCLRTFFDEFLRGAAATPAAIASTAYPEIQGFER